MLIIEDLNTGAIHKLENTCITKSLRAIREYENIILFLDKVSFKQLTEQQKSVLLDYTITNYNYDVFKLPALEIVVFMYNKPSDINRIKDGFVDYKNAHGITITHNYFLIRPFIHDNNLKGAWEMATLPNLPIEHIVASVNVNETGIWTRLKKRLGIYSTKDLVDASNYTLSIANDQISRMNSANTILGTNYREMQDSRDAMSKDLKEALIAVEVGKNSSAAIVTKLNEEKLTALDDQSRRYEERLRDNNAAHENIRVKLEGSVNELTRINKDLESKLTDTLIQQASASLPIPIPENFTKVKPTIRLFSCEEVTAIREMADKHSVPLKLLKIVTGSSSSTLSRMIRKLTYAECK
jgi:hypothetical protein